MSELVLSLVGKLKDCLRRESDEKISKYLHKMMEAFENLPLLWDAEWKRETDGAAKQEISEVRQLVEQVEDIIDLYYLLLFSKDKTLRRVNYINKMYKLSSKIRQFLKEDQDYPRSYVLPRFIQVIWIGNIMGSSIQMHFPDLFMKFSDKVCNDLKNLKLQETESVSKFYHQVHVELIEDHIKHEPDWNKLNIHHGLDHSLVGRQNDTVSFRASLFGKDKGSASLACVALYGIGGIGKTCLARALYRQVKSKFSCYAWINTLGKKTLEILQEMWMAFIKSQSVSAPRDVSFMDEDEASLLNRIQYYLIGKQFLLVLDDISSVNFWKSVKEAFPRSNTKGKIILTSRISGFPDCVHINPTPLESKDAFDLLSKHAFSGTSSDSAGIMESISTLCRGNPFVIKIVGGMLNDSTKLHQVYERMMESCTEKQINGEQNSCFIPLCYAALTPVLKSCFLYAALFPPQSQINCKRLMRLWIAEGFIYLKDKSKTKEDIAELQLHELIRRNLFQVTKLGTNGKPVLFQLLRPLREFALKRSQEDGFSVTSETGIGLPVEKPLRLSLINPKHSKSYMDIDKTNYSRLRSLLVLQGSKLHTSFIKVDLVSSLKLLRVLELQDMPIDALPDSLGKLFLMRYLGLRRTKLVELPYSLGKLKDLKTLDIRDTMVRSLPENLEHLTELRHLLLALSFDDKAVNLPVVIADFKQLQTLAGVQLTECIAKSLLELPQLQKLSVGKVKSDMLELLAKSINQMVHLQSLSINCDLGEKLHSKFFEHSSTSKIERLRVRGRTLHLLDWVNSLKSLRSLHIWDCLLTEDPFLELGKLPKLEFLSARNAYIGHRIEFHRGAFPNLKKLSIIHFPALSVWNIGDGTVENLEKLTIESCLNLTKLPSCFRKLANFHVMNVTKMPEAFTEEARKFMVEGANFSLVVRS